MPVTMKQSGYKPSYDPKTGRVKVLARLSYCKPTEKTKSIESGRALYRSNALIYKDGRMDGDKNLAVIREARIDAMKKHPKWKGKSEEALEKLLKAMEWDRRGLLDGNKYTDDEGEIREHYEDTWFLKVTSDRKPKLKARDGDDLDDDEALEKIVSGNWAVIYFHFYCVSDQKKGGNGVFPTLDAIQFFKKDEVFSSNGIDDDEIDNLGDDDEDEDDEDDMDSKKSSKKRSRDDDEDEDDRRSSKKRSRDEDI